MATLKTITGKRGESYKVEWREGGSRNGAWRTETFNPQKNPARDQKAAEDFCEAVNAAGQNWPDFYAPGLGYLTPAQFLASGRVAAAEPTVPGVAVMTLDEFAPGHIDSLTKVEPATKVRYQQVYRDRVGPFFGAANLRDDDAPTARDARKWVNALIEGEKNPEYDPDAENPEDCPEWLREPCSAKTVRNTHSVVSLLFKAAAEEKLRHFNPFYKIPLPSPEDDAEGDEEMCYLDPEEFALLLDAMDIDARPLTEFLAGTGLRFGEATALKIKDLHLDDPKPHFRVWRAWKQGGHLGTTKTKQGKRRVGLTPDQAGMLRMATAGRERDRGAFVFLGPGGGAWPHSTYYSQRWQHALYRATRCPACRAADYEAGIGRRGYRDLTMEHIVPCGHDGTLERIPRVHDLRHTHVAWLIRLNVPLLAISRRLGHKSIGITADRYGHLLPEVEDEMVAGLGGMMRRVDDARFRLAA
jgi:integrase